MKKVQGAVTIRDVAHLAGLSTATVSKVLNDGPNISKDARERVEAAITKLNFRPNTIARSLKKSSTLTLGLITDDIEGVFTMSLMRGVEQAASVEGFSVLLCNSYGEAARERAHLDTLLAKQVDGIILLSGYRVRERGAPALPLGNVPVVYLYQYTYDTAATSIIPDDENGGWLATQHLIQLGRKRIAMLNGPTRYEATHHRFKGYRRALEEGSVPFEAGWIRTGKWHENSGYALAHELMGLSEPPDSIFCASDSIAAGALDALHELGVRVPDDVAVVGYDNRPFAPYQRPPLTTVALPLVEMGELAGNTLIAAIARGEPETQFITHKVPCYLIPRASCGGVAAQAEEEEL